MTIHPTTGPRAAALLLVTIGLIFQGSVRAASEPPRSRLAFLRWTEGYWQVWLMDDNGDGSRQLTSSPVDKHSPSWCPGNEVLHFSTVRGDNVLLELASGALYPQLPGLALAGAPTDAHGDALPFDVDVRALLAREGYRSDSGVGCGTPDTAPSIVKEIHAPGGVADETGVVIYRKLTSELKPVYEIRTLELDDAATLERAGRSVSSTGRAVSTSGATAFLAHESGGIELWQSRTSDRSKTAVTNLAGSIGDPTWSHDGQWLIFDAEHEGLRQIYRARSDGTGLERLTSGDTPARGAVLSWPTRDGESR